MTQAGAPLRLEDLPPVLTVEEAAAVLRIGRGAAYELARRFEISNGQYGLPVIRLGRSLRVPKAELLRMLGDGDMVVELDAQRTARDRWARRPGA
jgi:excisionase family DNA binding protein